ncbi:glycosyltransferase [Methylobacterium durans]|nr:glycosyltransferase [Methylobacterium durans]
MIVKNEADVIVKCIESARRLIDYVLIVDTGSTDETQRLIAEYLHEQDIPGEVIEEAWVDFATNRTSCLRRLRQRTDISYALVLDADEVIVYDDDFNEAAFKQQLNKDFYHIKIVLYPTEYFRPQLLKNNLEFVYRGVLHEFIEAPPRSSSGTIESGFHIISGRGGARSRNPRKYEDDARTLEKALVSETDEFLVSRYTFYLAQSYRDSGNNELALKYYIERSRLGYWEEEIFYSTWQSAAMMEQLGYPDFEVIGMYLKAFEGRPTRAESLHAAMNFCRRCGLHHQGFLIGKHAVSITIPSSGLFVLPWIYEYGLLDEFSILAYWSGHFQESLDSCLQILQEGRIPSDQRERIEVNADFSRKKGARSHSDLQP